jgi:hypothetical protein
MLDHRIEHAFKLGPIVVTNDTMWSGYQKAMCLSLYTITVATRIINADLEPLVVLLAELTLSARFDVAFLT